MQWENTIAQFPHSTDCDSVEFELKKSQIYHESVLYIKLVPT